MNRSICSGTVLSLSVYFVLIWHPINSLAQSAKPEKYSAIIYTSDDISDDIQRVFDESQARGLGEELLNAGLSALKGIGAISIAFYELTSKLGPNQMIRVKITNFPHSARIW